MKPIIPIFFHIPKCAGTFVLGCMHSLFRQLGKMRTHKRATGIYDWKKRNSVVRNRANY